FGIAMKAYPEKGSIFTGWTGSVVSNSPAIYFAMQNGMSLQANFEPNPFPPVSGAYYGLVTTGSTQQAGMVQMGVSASGVFSGRIFSSGGTWSFVGALDASGSATV